MNTCTPAELAEILNDPWTRGADADAVRYYAREEQTRTDQRFVEFGMRDQRGRALGYCVTYCVVRHTPRSEHDRTQVFGGSIFPRERFDQPFAARTWPTRDGAAYGASSPTLYARNEAELEELVEARIGGARRRYARKFGGA